MSKKKIAQQMKKQGKVAARSQIKELFTLADKMFTSHPPAAHRAVTHARRIAMKFQLTIPKNLRRKFCRHCYKYIRPGVNSRVRTSPKGYVVIYCLECKKFTRIPTKKS